MDFQDLNSKEYILIKGARVHNLKNIDVAIPRNKFVVITGLSGSGKSSLAFDTLYAEGQRRYVESLSSYARQFMGRMDKPDVDYIHGISPAVAIEQKVNTRNPRSTVGTSTEIYDYLKLLYARIGKTISPVSGNVVKRDSVDDVVSYIQSFPDDTKMMLYAPMHVHGRSAEDELKILLQKGFTRVAFLEEVIKIEDLLDSKNSTQLKSLEKLFSPAEKKTTSKKKKSEPASLESTAIDPKILKVMIDRIVVQKSDDSNRSRIADSVQTAFNEGGDECWVATQPPEGGLTTAQSSHASSTAIHPAVNSNMAAGSVPPSEIRGLGILHFSSRFELDGITFEEPTTHLFNFNNPYGACKRCEGFGSIIGIDEDLVIPDKSKSVYDMAIVCWRGEKMSEYYTQLIKSAYKFDFPIHKPVYELTREQRRLLWTGNQYFDGIDKFFKWVETQSYKIQYRVMLSRYRGRTICPDCRGTRLRLDASYVKVNEKSIIDIVLMPVKESVKFFNEISLSKYEETVAKRILIEIRNRLQYLCDVGLGYLTLNRLSSTLSGGESQRINLSTSLGSALVGSTYILDEPSIGLHPRDTQRLIKVLNALRDTGNTLVVVEHDEVIMHAADILIDIGPGAGQHGGELVAQGTYKEIIANKNSLTGKYLSGKEKIPLPYRRRTPTGFIGLEGARENNLKNINVKFPLGVMTVVTGVSGSGKSSLVKKILYPALKKIHGGFGEFTGTHDKLTGDYSKLSSVEFIDQNPIGKSSRSNPVTYIKVYDEIRNLYAEHPTSRARKYKPSHFSFNVEGGRCDVCQGEGEVTIEMQFMADIHLVCENCHGKRFKSEILDVEYRGKNIADVLDMTVDEAIEFFSTPVKSFGYDEKIAEKLRPLQDVGLGYIHLGQSSSTLSGGEAQRVKLASFIGKGNTQGQVLFIFDEPTTGLHFHDIKKLLKAFDMLLDQGHSIIIVEHNTEVIKCADWVIDIGPEGGDEGGYILFEGSPDDLVDCENSYTGQFLKGKIPVNS